MNNSIKKVILGLFLLIGLGFSHSSPNLDANFISTEYTQNAIVKCKYGQCTATAKSTGKRCKHCVSNRGDTTCWQH